MAGITASFGNTPPKISVIDCRFNGFFKPLFMTLENILIPHL